MASIAQSAKDTVARRFDAFELSKVIVRTRQPVANGVAAVERTLTLSRNAVVEPPFAVKIAAGVAEWAASQNVGQVRQQDITDTAGRQTRTSMVVDFGVLRTVSGVAVDDASRFHVIQVRPWAGAAFADKPIFNVLTSTGRIDASSPVITAARQQEAMFSSEVRTERLQIDLIGSGTNAELGESIFVRLPDVPADLDLRINDSPPVWTARGAAVAGSNQWTAGADGLLEQPPVDIAAALNRFVADPAASKQDTIELRITLSARVPGALSLTLPPESARTVRFVAPVPFEQGTRELKMVEEGLVVVPLTLPDWVAKVEKVTATSTANLPPERVMPPLGPDEGPVGGTDSRPLAEVMLDPDHAACVELLTDHGLEELVGVRLPLRAGPQGAEVRVMLLSRGELNEPGTPLDGGVSTPIAIDPPSDSEEAWTSFAFASPVPVDSENLPFVAAIVSRGLATWSLTGASDPANPGRILRGAPTGPWEPLPSAGPLASLRGRVRIAGHAANDAPVAPLLIEARGTGGTAVHPPVNVTPTPKGVAVEWPAAQGALLTPRVDAGKKIVDLYVVSRTVGAVTLRDVRVVATDT